jgi:hypothetical protein
MALVQEFAYLFGIFNQLLKLPLQLHYSLLSGRQPGRRGNRNTTIRRHMDGA